jgi:cyclopropane fatty-acyl-phospholipid synthase-like methyltransferase
MLIVGERYELTLDYDTECHGSITMCEIYDKMDVGNKAKHLKTWMKAMDKNIKAGSKFINYVFVDTDDGEASDFNVLDWLDEYMLKRNLYPAIIINAINNFKNKV